MVLVHTIKPQHTLDNEDWAGQHSITRVPQPHGLLSSEGGVVPSGVVGVVGVGVVGVAAMSISGWLC